MGKVASTRRPFDPSATARFMLLSAGVLVGCGLINIFVLNGQHLGEHSLFRRCGLKLKWAPRCG
jgi:hypothetical protein